MSSVSSTTSMLTVASSLITSWAWYIITKACKQHRQRVKITTKALCDYWEEEPEQVAHPPPHSHGISVFPGLGRTNSSASNQWSFKQTRKIVFGWLMRLCLAVILVKHFSHRIHLHPQFDFIPQCDRTFSVALHRRRHQWKHLCPYRLHFEWPQFTFFRRDLKKSILAERYYFLCMITQFSCQKLFCRFENSWKIVLIRGW